MKISREPATPEPAIKIGHQYIPIADGITLRDLHNLADFNKEVPINDASLVEIIADYTKRQEIEQERRQVREEYKGGLSVNEK